MLSLCMIVVVVAVIAAHFAQCLAEYRVEQVSSSILGLHYMCMMISGSISSWDCLNAKQVHEEKRT